MSYVERIQAAAPEERWRMVKGWIVDEPRPFFAEMRSRQPILVLPELTMAFRYADCALVLRRHQDFGVDLYKPKQGDYFMAQDDTAVHWREKSIMQSILDYEEIPRIRAFVAETTAKILNKAGGRIDLTKQISRKVPVEVVREFFGLEGDPDDLIEWSYWNQQDAFHNQPFDHSPEAEHIVAQREKGNKRMALRLARTMAKRAIPARMGVGSDPLSRMLKLSFSDGLKFSLKRVLVNAGGLLIGTVETSSHCVNNAIAELLARPDDLARAQETARNGEPEAIDGVTLEALRFRPAFPYFFRVCHKATELAGGTQHAHWVEPGTTVFAVTGSAMLDEANYPQPEVFDPARSQADNFTFGYGLHECLGKAIATQMAGEIVRQLLRLPGLAAAGPLELRREVPDSFPLRWDA